MGRAGYFALGLLCGMVLMALFLVPVFSGLWCAEERVKALEEENARLRSELQSLRAQLRTQEELARRYMEEAERLQAELHRVKYSAELNASLALAQARGAEEYYEELASRLADWFYGLTDTYSNSCLARCLAPEEVRVAGEWCKSLFRLSPRRFLVELAERVHAKLRYASDPTLPLPWGNGSVKNLVLSPSDALRLGYGDCEDYAYLALACIAAYQESTGNRFPVFLLEARSSDGKHHAALAVELDGELLVVDPTLPYVGSPASYKYGIEKVFRVDLEHRGLLPWRRFSYPASSRASR